MSEFSLDKDLFNFKHDRSLGDIAVIKDYIGDIKRWRKKGSYNGYVPPIIMLDLVQCRWRNQGKPHLNRDLIRLIGDYCCENKLAVVTNDIDICDPEDVDSYLEIVDMDTGIKEVINGDLEIYKISILNETTIVSISKLDLWLQYIQIWDINSRSEIKRIRCIDYELIGCINTINEHTFVTGNGPKDFTDGIHTLKIWDLDMEDDNSHDDDYESNLKTVLAGHTDLITCIAVIDNNTLISGSYDNTIRLWDTETKNTLAKWDCETYINSISLINVSSTEFSFVFGTARHRGDSARPRRLQIWNIKINNLNQDTEYTVSNKTVLYGHELVVSSVVVLNSNEIVSGSGDSTIRIWDIKKGEMIQKISGKIDNSLPELGLVNHIKKINQNMFISYDDKCGVQVWRK